MHTVEVKVVVMIIIIMRREKRVIDGRTQDKHT